MEVVRDEAKAEESANSTDAQKRRELVARIAASPGFCRAPQLQEFLIYITEQSLANESDQLTEQVIGTEVFKRKPGYSTGDDNIVRTYARQMRKRLDEYFATVGAAETLIISIPKGAYAVEFHERKAAEASPFKDHQNLGLVDPRSTVWEPPQHVETLPAGKKSSSARRLAAWTVLVPLTCCLIAAAILAAYRLGQQTTRDDTPAALHAFWAGVLGNNRTMIVPDDTGLTVAIGLIEQEVKPQDYVDGQYRKVLGQRFPNLQNWDRPFAHRYTDLVDLLAVSRLVKMPELGRQPTTIRYARDLRPEELDDGNVILLGGSNANPWVTLFDGDLNFSIRFKPVERSFEIVNRNPKQGEPTSYPYTPYSEGQAYYGLVAVRPNFKNSGNVLLLEGVTNSGLQAAVDFCLDERLIGELLKSVLNKNGTIRPFEVLVRTAAVGSTDPRRSGRDESSLSQALYEEAIATRKYWWDA